MSIFYFAENFHHFEIVTRVTSVRQKTDCQMTFRPKALRRYDVTSKKLPSNDGSSNDILLV